MHSLYLLTALYVIWGVVAMGGTAMIFAGRNIPAWVPVALIAAMAMTFGIEYAMAADAAAANMDTVQAALGAIWENVKTPAAISGLTAFLAAVLPKGDPGTMWGTVRLIVDLAANNWGNAKNR